MEVEAVEVEVEEEEVVEAVEAVEAVEVVEAETEEANPRLNKLSSPDKMKESWDSSPKYLMGIAPKLKPSWRKLKVTSDLTPTSMGSTPP